MRFSKASCTFGHPTGIDIFPTDLHMHHADLEIVDPKPLHKSSGFHLNHHGTCKGVKAPPIQLKPTETSIS